MLHVVEVGIGTERPIYGVREGGPNAPVKPEPLRVSITRQGVIAMNVIGPGGVKMLAACAIADEEEASGCAIRCSMRCCSASTGVGAQYNGEAQFLSGGFRG